MNYYENRMHTDEHISDCESGYFILKYNSLVINKTNLSIIHRIGYLSPWEITNKIFIIKNTDNEDQTFETIDSKK